MTKQPQQLIKEMFPTLPLAHRNQITTALLHKSRTLNIPFKDLADEYKIYNDKEREKGIPLFLKKILMTAVVIEDNDNLKDTYYDNQYDQVAKKSGKQFLNGLEKLYLREFNDLATQQQMNTNDLMKYKEIAIEALSFCFDEDFKGLGVVIDTWAKNKKDRKRFVGIANQIKKQSLKTEKEMINATNSIQLK